MLTNGITRISSFNFVGFTHCLQRLSSEARRVAYVCSMELGAIRNRRLSQLQTKIMGIFFVLHANRKILLCPPATAILIYQSFRVLISIL